MLAWEEGLGALSAARGGPGSPVGGGKEGPEALVGGGRMARRPGRQWEGFLGFSPGL